MEKRSTKKSQTITKEKFPGLLNKVYVKVCGNDSQSAQLVAGFKKTGIFPFNPDEIICRLPGSTPEVDTPALVSESVIEMLKDLRSGESSEKKQRKSKLNVQPGKSIGLEDLPKLLTSAHQKNKAEKIRIKLRKMVKGKKTTKGKVTKIVRKGTISKKAAVESENNEKEVKARGKKNSGRNIR